MFRFAGTVVNTISPLVTEPAMSAPHWFELTVPSSPMPTSHCCHQVSREIPCEVALAIPFRVVITRSETVETLHLLASDASVAGFIRTGVSATARLKSIFPSPSPKLDPKCVPSVGQLTDILETFPDSIANPLFEMGSIGARSSLASKLRASPSQVSATEVPVFAPESSRVVPSVSKTPVSD